MPQIALGDLTIEVAYKNIKNAYLFVYPPSGKVRISAPSRMDLEAVRTFAISRLSWIRRQQRKLQEQEREAAREHIYRESHLYLGKRYLLQVSEVDCRPTVELNHSNIEMRLRPDTGATKREEILNAWYRQRLKELIPPIIDQWEKKLNVTVGSFGIRRMKTRWGSCNPRSRRMLLNLELAKKPLRSIEYVVVHEMVHFLERTHGERFRGLMDGLLPGWKSRKEELNRLPLDQQDWQY